MFEDVAQRVLIADNVSWPGVRRQAGSRRYSEMRVS